MWSSSAVNPCASQWSGKQYTNVHATVTQPLGGPACACHCGMTTMLPVDYLKQFIERAADVPLQLRRRLALIRDLDEKATQLQREIDEQCRKQLSGKSRSDNASKRQRLAATAEPDAQYDVDSALKRLISLADEKASGCRRF